MAVHLAFSVVVVAMSMVTKNGNPESTPHFLGVNNSKKGWNHQLASIHMYIYYKYIYIYMTSPIFLGGENLKNKNVLKPPPLVSI